MRVGILGGGQLAQMLTQAAVSLGIETAIYERQPDSPASRLTHFHVVGEWDDLPALIHFAEGCDLLTLENEFVYAESLAHLERAGHAVYPSAATLATVQDKYRQKQCYAHAGLDVPAFAEVDSPADVARWAQAHGYPVVLKARYGGYDGYGNATIHTEDALNAAWERLSRRPHTRLMVEAYAPFVRELAVMIVRGRDGETRAYPVVETVQQDHICHVVRAPAPVDGATADAAVRLATAAVVALGGVGVFGVELFHLADGGLLLNEVAPRPHNSGHYTIEACETSQFENHLRAVLGYPLGDTGMVAPCAVMVNALGTRDGITDPQGVAPALAIRGARVHVYGKRESRVGRKMGHVTALGASLDDAEARARAAVERLKL